MATVLLTGGTGYIGSHTAVELIQAGHSVVIMDNLCNSEENVIGKIAEITGTAPKFYLADACDRAAAEKIFEENKIDAVIHFAGLKAVGESWEIPLTYYENNIGSAVNILQTMKKYGCHNIIFSSSATVYGENCKVPYTEDMQVGQCSNPYGRTKYFIENIISDAATADKEMSAVLLRYFNPIGCHPSGILSEQPKGVPNNLLPYIVRVAKGIYPYLNLFGNDYDTPDGTCIRDYIHVLDLASGHLAALNFALKNKGCEVFNLGTGKGTSVLEMINTYEEATGAKVPYEIAPRRAGDLPAGYADASKAERVLGWKAVHTVAEGCRDSHNAK